MTFDINQLQSELSQTLPGWDAQKKMAPMGRENDTHRSPSEDYRKAGVMALIYTDEEAQFQLILIERAKHNPKDKHAGQLALPGGKYEKDDKDMLTCALREVEEEIGLSQHKIRVLGALSPLYVAVSNFMIYPYVGYVKCGNPNLIPQKSEVHSILRVPLSILKDDNNKGKKTITTSYASIKGVPYYNIEGKTLWGATAMVISELEAILQRG